MSGCTSSSPHGFSFFLASYSSQEETQYPQHDVPKDLLNWYGPSNGTTAPRSGQFDEDSLNYMPEKMIELVCANVLGYLAAVWVGNDAESPA